MPFQSSSLSCSSTIDLNKPPSKSSDIFGSQLKCPEIERAHLRFMDSSKRNPALRLKAVMESPGHTQDITDNKPIVEEATDHFKVLQRRFLGFKKDKYLSNLEHYQRLSEAQAPKFMVIACADSRVCPSSVLGFQPGEAFVIRNVANLVPPHENGPTETNAALEFAVNTLEVENLLVVGHSCCGGIKALMSLESEAISSSSFIRNWVVVGKAARSRTEAAASHLDFDQQCRHCEKLRIRFSQREAKTEAVASMARLMDSRELLQAISEGSEESINRSLFNLLTYPWINERVKKGRLSIHGGYYDFIDCTFEKWTLDYNAPEDSGCSIKNREFWS